MATIEELLAREAEAMTRFRELSDPVDKARLYRVWAATSADVDQALDAANTPL